jgi:mannose-6-phosphate isomerase-like protein (cupin superfamily)
MATPGDRLVEPSGVELLFVETAASSGGRRLEVEWTIPAGRRLVARAHRHPDGPEDWAVLEGQAGYEVRGEQKRAEAGEAWQVPPNASHVHPWNAGGEPLRVRQAAALDRDGVLLGVERYFETLMALAQRGQVDERFDIRPQLQSVLTIRELLMPGSYLAGPPTWLQEAVFAPLAALARRRGYAAYVEPERAAEPAARVPHSKEP